MTDPTTGLTRDWHIKQLQEALDWADGDGLPDVIVNKEAVREALAPRDAPGYVEGLEERVAVALHNEAHEWRSKYGGKVPDWDKTEVYLQDRYRRSAIAALAVIPAPSTMVERTAPGGYAAGIEAAKKAAENWEPVEKLLPLCDEDANEAAMTGQWEARERIVDAIDALAATPPSMAVVPEYGSLALEQQNSFSDWVSSLMKKGHDNDWADIPVEYAKLRAMIASVKDAGPDSRHDPSAAPHFKGPGPLDERPVGDDE